MLGHVNVQAQVRPRHGEDTLVPRFITHVPKTQYDKMAKELWDIYSTHATPSVQGRRMLNDYDSFRSFVANQANTLYQSGEIVNPIFSLKDPNFSAALLAQIP